METYSSYNAFEVAIQTEDKWTSAGVKSHFSYEKFIDMFENSIITPKDSFVIGLDYRIPIAHGLLDRNYVNKLKLAPSFNQESFAREYLSLWSGSSEESWFNYDKISKYRKLKNPEWRYQKSRVGEQGFYLLSMDVGRLGDRSEVCVFRVNPQNGIFYATLVNIVTLGRTPETRQFSYQARDLKRLIKLYQPKEVLIDTNGLGISMADEMIKTHYDLDGTELPPYGFFNSDEYKKIQPKDAPQILYSMKANGPLNSQIHGNAYSRINTGRVRFLINEQEAKSALLSLKMGQKMKTEDKIKRLLPHQQTTNLFTQMANLRLKRTGTGLDIVLEQINARFPKDKYSALAYGLWRIKELEEEAAKRKKNRRGNRKLVFYTEGG